MALLHEGYDSDSELAAALEMSRGDVREHMNVIRGATVKRLMESGMDRNQVAVTLGIAPNEVALCERAVR